MKKVFLLILTVCLSLSALSLAAQEYVAPPITISKEKVRIDGKTYYSHVVLEKQTIYSISKAYGVTIELLYAANPNLKENGLKKNSILLIPTYDADRTAKEIRKEAATQEKLNRQQERLRKQQEKNSFITHTVKWYEDLDVISEKYGVPVEAIMAVNGLTGRKLSNRQKLRIPLSDKAAPVIPVTPAGKLTAESTAGTDIRETITGEPLSHAAKSNINAVVMLPFNASGERKSESSMDFYSGILLAARELGNNGINIDLNVYDIKDSTLIVTEDVFDKADMIIGPIDSKDLSSLLEKSPESTCVISPLDPRAEALAETNPNLIHVPSSTKAQYMDLVNWIKEEMSPADTIIIVHEKSLKGTDEAKDLRERLDADSLSYMTFSYSLLEGRDIVDTLATQIAKVNTNRVLVASESEAFANDVVRNFTLLHHNKYPVVLYCNSKMRSYETADIDNLHNANTRISMSYHIDYDDPKVQKFLMMYRALYNTEPTRFSFLGYDTMNYFVSLCAKYGNDWKSRLTEDEGKMLQSTFRFLQIPGGGYINTATRRLVYNPDYSVTEVKGQ